ncbi:Hypothetical protein A7982_11430 [Minicystis rosea]|nr:Hypothetical protein A7982_11430 [Minicystis rosea]
MPKKKEPSPAKPEAPSKSAEALALVKAEAAALDPTQLTAINVDIPQAVALVLGVIPHLAELRPAIVKSLVEHPIASFDKLGTYALAAYHAHILALPPEGSAQTVGLLLEEATPLRENLLSDAEALARRGLLDTEAVKAIRAGQGNIDKANDLVALSALFSTKWSAVQHKTAAAFEEVQRAGELGPLLLAALGAREHGIALTPDEAADLRRRTYTLFFRAYDETRRALAYLRWHEGDADVLAPSLFKGRRSRTTADSTNTPEHAPAAGEGGAQGD